MIKKINNRITLSPACPEGRLSKCAGLNSNSYFEAQYDQGLEAFKATIKNTKIVCEGLITCDLISDDMRVPISGFVNYNKIPHVFF